LRLFVTTELAVLLLAFFSSGFCSVLLLVVVVALLETAQALPLGDESDLEEL